MAGKLKLRGKSKTIDTTNRTEDEELNYSLDTDKPTIVSSSKIIRTTIKDETNTVESAKGLFEKLKLMALYREKALGTKEKRIALEEMKIAQEFSDRCAILTKFIVTTLDRVYTEFGHNSGYIAKIQIDSEYTSVIDVVLNSYELLSYEYTELDCNENLVILGANEPRTFLFSAKTV